MSVFKTGHIPWNKGKTGLYSNEYKAKIKVKMTDTVREKISKAQTGKKRKASSIKKMVATARKRGNYQGNKSPWWRGGLVKKKNLIRKSEKYKAWRTAVYKRDNYTCIQCSTTKDLNADHIIPFYKLIQDLISLEGIENLFEKAMNYAPLWDISNGRTLCHKCHVKTDTYGIKAWKRCAAQLIEGIDKYGDNKS